MFTHQFWFQPAVILAEARSQRRTPSLSTFFLSRLNFVDMFWPEVWKQIRIKLLQVLVNDFYFCQYCKSRTPRKSFSKDAFCRINDLSWNSCVKLSTDLKLCPEYFNWAICYTRATCFCLFPLFWVPLLPVQTQTRKTGIYHLPPRKGVYRFRTASYF